jgi:hypothetical protein
MAANTEILIPFGLDVNGSIASTSDPDVQQAQHVESLVSTNPGERVMLPKYGVPLASYLFGNGPSSIAVKISKDVSQAMAVYEPGVTVLSVTPVADDQGGVAEIEVDYLAAPEDTSASQTASVTAGGTVTVA